MGTHIASEKFTVFIALASEGTDVRALFELPLLDHSWKGKHKVHSHFQRSLENGPYAFMWRAMLETSDFPKDDCQRKAFHSLMLQHQ
ncbi:hypothetical protein Sjap_002109 [Stephania japonica]|uniref:Uncharacterized protein n=1 Tax=Stephania japonica TaxID=461633 RepID=A0AAP0PU69_9MAGN